MRKSRFTKEHHPEGTRTILQEHETGGSVAEVGRGHGVSEQAVYRWRQK